MGSYHISDLERLSGIKAHTIRIWERRYHLFLPHRTLTNIRYYDDEQLRKLLNVALLLKNGHKISEIALMSEQQINSRIQQLQTNSGDVISDGFINELVTSMMAFDEGAFERGFSAAVTRFGMYNAILKVIYPFLHKTGLMWSAAELMPVHEHFASSIIRRKIIAGIDGLPAPSRKNKKFLLFLPAEEWHETALLLADYMIRSEGYQTVYLGQNVPDLNLSLVIKETSPTHLLSFYISQQSGKAIEKELSTLASAYKSKKILVGTHELAKPQVKKLKNVYFLAGPSDLMGVLKS